MREVRFREGGLYIEYHRVLMINCGKTYEMLDIHEVPGTSQFFAHRYIFTEINYQKLQLPF